MEDTNLFTIINEPADEVEEEVGNGSDFGFLLMMVLYFTLLTRCRNRLNYAENGKNRKEYSTMCRNGLILAGIDWITMK